MTRIKFKLKNPYGMFGKILFQTATRLLKKKAMQNLIKKKPTAYPQNKRRKKNKNPKPQTVFPDQNLDYRFFATPSNTQIGLACSNLSNTNPL